MINTENMILELLKKIQSSVSNLEKSYDSLDKRVANLEEKQATHDHWTIHAIGLGTMAKSEAEQALAELKILSRKIDANDN
jgi:hypothetical protein